jgi:DNA anti-recombination protein RmuC
MQKKKRHQAQSQEVAEMIEKLYAQYGKFARSDEETRKIVDKAMGTKTLTEALNAMREG